ncbi:YdcF family protein [Photobacterium minamisatsumaniensis]|uniref:YdcF family protein n=1 Tax=Photobacterium minamisatsumaniensis TaxID=2910233 RepID=UPI003D0AD61E
MFKKLPLAALIVFSICANAATRASDTLLHKRMKQLESIEVSASNVADNILEGHFDKVFDLYDNLNHELLAMKQFSSSVDTTLVIQNLEQNKIAIINEVFDTVLENTGETFPKSANFTPKGIIVVGSTPEMGILESRLDDAYKIAMDNKSLPIILSGKGRKKGIVEADYMYDYLVSKGLAGDRLYKELLALDTVGNAEFSYFTITENESLKDITDWLVITNNYHAMRSLNNFQYVFPDNYNVAVHLSPLLPEGVTHPDRLTILKQLVAEELKSESNHQFMELLTYDRFKKKGQAFKPKTIAGQPCAILNEMLIEHGLYKDKVDELTVRFSQCYTSE